MMIDKTHTIYVELFRELYAAQRERQALVDLQTKLAQINQDLDSAMVEALSFSFEFVRAGGNRMAGSSLLLNPTCPRFSKN